MKKIVFSFSRLFNSYITEEKFRTKNYQLYNVKQVLDIVDRWQVDIKNLDSLDELTAEGIAFEYMSNLKQLWIWPAFLIKKQQYKEFKTLEEFSQYNRIYEEYYDKRWEEIPKIEISIQDWEFLQKKWHQIKEENPKYIVFTLDDSADLDKIDLFGKDELSEQDLQDMKIDHEQYLQYKVALQKYRDNLSCYSDIWRGPQDDEYEADWQKFLDEPLD
jgi:hypothetical protein